MAALAYLWPRSRWDLPAQYRIWQLYRYYADATVGTADSTLLQLLDRLEWIFTENTRTRNPYPILPTRYHGQAYHLYGPDDGLSSITAGEWAFLDHYFMSYANTKEMHWADMMLATLYRPATTDQHMKQPKQLPFQPEWIEKMLPITERLPLPKKMAIITYIHGSRQQIVEQHKGIFHSGKETRAQQSTSGWLDLFLELGNGLTGYEVVAQQPLSVVLKELQRQMDKSFKQKQQLEKAKKKKG